MSGDYLNKLRALSGSRSFRVPAILVWSAGGFLLAQVLVSVGLSALFEAGVPFNQLGKVVLTFVISLAMYAAALLIVVGIPTYIHRWSWSDVRKRLGIVGRPQGVHGVAAIFGFAVYIGISWALLWAATQGLSWFDISQKQALGFDSFETWPEVIVGFLAFVILAPIAEELFFRGFLFGRLRRLLPFWAAALLTSMLFGLAHGQLNVGIDTFALSLVLCFLYEGSGAIWSSIVLHMLKNGVAFALLFQMSSLQ